MSAAVASGTTTTRFSLVVGAAHPQGGAYRVWEWLSRAGAYGAFLGYVKGSQAAGWRWARARDPDAPVTSYSVHISRTREAAAALLVLEWKRAHAYPDCKH